LFVPAMPLVEVPKPPEAAVRPARPMESFFQNGGFRAPSFIPHTVAVFEEPPLPPALPANITGPGLLGADLLGTNRNEAEPPAPPVAPTLTQRIRQSQIEPAMILSQAQPAYPPLPRSVGIQGDVILHAIIDREGRVAELEVVSGHPLLAKAALDAVRTWRYRPTLLNGEPVEVETTIKVSFVLGR
jgi:protein TonB